MADRRSRSDSLSFASASRSAATASVAEPSKKVRTTCLSADFRARSRLTIGKKDVARTVLLVADVSFLLEQPEHRAHGGVARRIGNVVEHLGGGGASAAIDDVHDLSFAATELRGGFRPCGFVGRRLLC